LQSSARIAWQARVVDALEATPGALAATGVATSWSSVGGNALSAVWSLRAGARRFFVKVVSASTAGMLAAEADGLQAIGRTGAIRVPSVVTQGEAAGAAFLVLEWLALGAGGRGASLGRSLAKLHATTAARFGWHRDNTIGLTPQANAWGDDWPAFFRDRRLAPQFALAASRGYAGLARRGERLLACVPALLEGHRAVPSLLHGDLWSGNAGELDDGTPVVFDPCCYFGDREADVAMAELFGGFSPAFHAAYAEAAPLEAGYPLRRTLYNLYHVVNHLNLFGRAYLARADAMVDELLAAAG
jgi:fructosamine-3-kinase